MIAEYIQKFYKNVKKGVFGCHDSDNVWLEKNNEKLELFVVFVQFCIENTETRVKNMEILAYPVHALLLDMSVRRMQNFIDNEHTLAVFQQPCCTAEHLEEKRIGECEDMSV